MRITLDTQGNNIIDGRYRCVPRDKVKLQLEINMKEDLICLTPLLATRRKSGDIEAPTHSLASFTVSLRELHEALEPENTIGYGDAIEQYRGHTPVKAQENDKILQIQYYSLKQEINLRFEKGEGDSAVVMIAVSISPSFRELIFSIREDILSIRKEGGRPQDLNR